MVDLIMLLLKLLTSNPAVLCGKKARYWDGQFPGETNKSFQMRPEGETALGCWLRHSKEPQSDEDSNYQGRRNAPVGCFRLARCGSLRRCIALHRRVGGDSLEQSTPAESQMNYVYNPGLRALWCRKAGLPLFPTCVLYSSASYPMRSSYTCGLFSIILTWRRETRILQFNWRKA